ncbi:uncharacterized protein YciI [Staphylococcus caledonicus]
MNNYKGNVSYLDELEVNEMYPNIYIKGLVNMNSYKGNVSYVDEFEVNEMYPNIYLKDVN